VDKFPAIAPGGFTVAGFAARMRDMTGQAGYTIRNAAYDLASPAASTWQANPAASAGTSSHPVPAASSRPDHPPGTRHRAPAGRRRPADPPESAPLYRH